MLRAALYPSRLSTLGASRYTWCASQCCPRYRGLAIGVRLLSDRVEFARGADLMMLNTQSYNTEAQRLYEWFGFRRIGERQAILRYNLS